MMFGDFTDRRTPAERQRDQNEADERNANQLLSVGLLNQLIPILQNHGYTTGLAGKGSFGKAELLIKLNDVTYELNARVNHET